MCLLSGERGDSGRQTDRHIETEIKGERHIDTEVKGERQIDRERKREKVAFSALTPFHEVLG